MTSSSPTSPRPGGEEPLTAAQQAAAMLEGWPYDESGRAAILQRIAAALTSAREEIAGLRTELTEANESADFYSERFVSAIARAEKAEAALATARQEERKEFGGLVDRTILHYEDAAAWLKGTPTGDLAEAIRSTINAVFGGYRSRSLSPPSTLSATGGEDGRDHSADLIAAFIGYYDYAKPPAIMLRGAAAAGSFWPELFITADAADALADRLRELTFHLRRHPSQKPAPPTDERDTALAEEQGR